jgi:hypothetical protein
MLFSLHRPLQRGSPLAQYTMDECISRVDCGSDAHNGGSWKRCEYGNGCVMQEGGLLLKIKSTRAQHKRFSYRCRKTGPYCEIFRIAQQAGP